MLKTRLRGRMEPPEIYAANPLGVCPECHDDVDEDEAHETLDGRFTHKSCLPFCDHCRDVLLHDTCEEGMVVVARGPLLSWRLLDNLGRLSIHPVHDATFSGRFCSYCFYLTFFGIGA